jgi:alpha-mannosidase II
VDIGDMSDTEIVMRISTNINSKDTFYTDLNGLQIIKRERFGKIPLQANYYPIPTSIYIEDESIRLTLLTAQPLGGSSLKSGQLEIMQDRRLLRDDNRGLGQGVLDNQPTLHIFKLILENRESCTKWEPSYPAGFLTLNSHHELQTLLHPFEKLVYHENDWVGAIPQFGLNHEPFEHGIEIAAVRELPHVKTKDKSSIGVVVHRKHFTECSNDINRDGIFNVKRLFGLSDSKEIYSAPLTLLKTDAQLTSDEVSICPMDIKAFIIER